MKGLSCGNCRHWAKGDESEKTAEGKQLGECRCGPPGVIAFYRLQPVGEVEAGVMNAQTSRLLIAENQPVKKTVTIYDARPINVGSKYPPVAEDFPACGAHQEIESWEQQQ